MQENTNIELHIEPFKGIGPINFTMTRNNVEHAFTHVYSSFFKVEDSKFRSDHNQVTGVITHYNNQGIVECIELVPKLEYSNIKVYFKDTEITNFSVEDGIALFLAFSKDFTKDNYGYSFHDLGTSVHLGANESKKLIDNIGLVSDQNYWKKNS